MLFATRLTILSTLLLCVVPAQGKIPWEKDLQKALERAKAENKLLVACISMKGERVCDVITAEHYADAKLVQLARKTVNLFCSPHGTPAQREMEKRVRIDLLKKDANALMVAPQHVFFTPDGKVLSSASYFITAGELEWMWAEALRAHDSAFKWEYSDRMRAPRQLRSKKIAVSKEVRKPPTKQELDAILREIKRGYGGYYGAREKLPVIVRHPSGQARKFVERILKALETSDSSRVSILRTIGANSPRSWYGVVAPYVLHEKNIVRIAAAQTLGLLGEKKGLKALHGRWRRESDPAVKAAILRAMVRCGPSDSRVVKMLPFILREYDDELIRLNAVLAVGGLEHRKAVAASLTQALSDKSARVRSTAAYTIASRRETEMLNALHAATRNEEDAEVRKWMEAASKVIGGETMDLFDGFIEEIMKRS